MGMIEKIDWDELDGEIYSVIAHASAGTDFCSPDLQMAVDGCIVEIKRAMKEAEERFTSAKIVNTPLLGSDGVHCCRHCGFYTKCVAVNN